MFSVVSVCLSFCSLGRGPHVTTTHDAIGQVQATWSQYPSPTLTIQGPSPGQIPPDMFKHVKLGPHHTRTSLPVGNSWEAGGWLSTERHSCCIHDIVTTIMRDVRM